MQFNIFIMAFLATLVVGAPPATTAVDSPVPASPQPSPSPTTFTYSWNAAVAAAAGNTAIVMAKQAVQGDGPAIESLVFWLNDFVTKVDGGNLTSINYDGIPSQIRDVYSSVYEEAFHATPKPKPTAEATTEISSSA